MITRRSVWSNAEIQSLLEQFIPAADEVGRLQRGTDAESRLFQKIAEQGHYAGREKPTSTRQGIYAIAPDGSFLASINTRRASSVKRMLETALDRFRAMDADTRTDGSVLDQAGDVARRWDDQYPENGLALVQVVRDLPRANDPRRARDWRREAWNFDHVWFNRSEARTLLPADEDDWVVGANASLEAKAAQRFVRLHIVDTVCGQSPAFRPEEVIRAELTSEIVEVSDQTISMKLRGASMSASRGEWPIDGFRDMNNPGPQLRGVETSMLGRAIYDRATGRFTTFKLIALGTRIGGTQYNARDGDLGRQGIGFSFSNYLKTPNRWARRYQSRMHAIMIRPR